MSPHRKISLKVIAAPATGPVVSAPPVLKASDHLRKLRRRFAACRRTVKSTIWRSTALNAARTIQRMGRSSTIIGLRPPLDVQRVP
jgi:hypothetical protein